MTDPTAEPQFGSEDCTCIPFTRQTNPPRILNRPTDTVDMISGWERGRDCPHHAPKQTDLRDRIAAAVWERCNVEGISPRLVVDDPRNIADAVLAVLPPPADRATVLLEAADVAARFNSDCQNCAVELEVATELRRMAAEAQQQPECSCDPAPHREEDDTYSHWAGCPVADAEQQADAETATPCGPAPSQCDAESGEPCTNHEREAAHAEGEHCFCGPECEAACTP